MGWRGCRARASCVAAIAVLCGAAPSAMALIVQGMQGMPRPPKGFIGRYNGSSGTAIASRWLISAKHCGGGVGSSFILRGETYSVVQQVQHPTMDLQLLRVDRDMPGWHAIAQSATTGDRVLMAGWGRTAGAALSNGQGYDWNGPWQETWGANTLSFVGATLGTTFDAPSSPNAVAYESQAAINDSGGAIFVVDPNGTIRLAGVITSVSGYGSAAYGSATYGVSLLPVRDWIVSNIGSLSVISHGIMAEEPAQANAASGATPPLAPSVESDPRKPRVRGAARVQRSAAAVETRLASAPASTPVTVTPPAPPRAATPHRATLRGEQRRR